MFINMSAFNEKLALEKGLSINDVALIGYLDFMSRKFGNDEFMYSYEKVFKNLKILFNCKTLNANYKKIKKMLDSDNVSEFVQRTHKRNGTKGIEVTFNLNREMINRLDIGDMFSEERE